MKSLEERKYTRTLVNAYNESCKEIEEKRLISILKAIARQNDKKVSLKKISSITCLNAKTISKTIARQGYMFKCRILPEKRYNYTAEDISLSLTKIGKDKLKIENL